MDHVLWRSKIHHPVRCDPQTLCSGKAALIEIGGVGHHYIDFEPRRGMEDVELAVSLDSLIHRFWTEIEISRRESGAQLIDLKREQPDDNIDVIGEPWLAICNGRHRASDQILNLQILDDLGQFFEEFSLIHRRAFSLPPASTDGHPNRGVSWKGG